MKLHGIDFTSAPTRRKAITISSGALDGDAYIFEALNSLHDYAAFNAWLRRPGPWLGAWAWQRKDAQFGMPDFDPLEGWIVGA